MKSYIKNTLGLHVTTEAWEDTAALPDELKQKGKYELLKISGIQCLVIYKDNEKFQLSDFQKESIVLKQYCEFPQVICFDRVTAYQRKCLIENRQPFVVPENQLYLPFLGIALQEHFKAQAIASQTMTAMAQYVLLFFFYHREQEYYSKLEISKLIDVNLMNVSRSVQELEELALLSTKKKGRSSMVTGTVQDKQELYQKALPYMRNPVQKKLFVRADDWILKLPISGMKVREEKPEKVGKAHRTRAIEKKVFLEKTEDIQTVDPAWDIDVDYLELEVWRYDPARFSDGKYVDSISYALSLEGECDMAMKMDINELL